MDLLFTQAAYAGWLSSPSKSGTCRLNRRSSDYLKRRIPVELGLTPAGRTARGDPGKRVASCYRPSSLNLGGLRKK